MVHKKSGLNDSDKIFVTIALWICAVSLFAILLTLPMLPDNVAIFDYPTEDVANELNSKFMNLLLIFMLIIPAIIVLIASGLKKRNRLKNNFMSIMLFCIILSVAFSSLIIYGIVRQFEVNNLVKTLNYHGLIATMTGFILSMIACILPTAVHSDDGEDASGLSNMSIFQVAIKYWNVGAYGYLLASIICVLTPDLYCYIPIAATFIAHIVFLAIMNRKVKE